MLITLCKHLLMDVILYINMNIYTTNMIVFY